MNVRDYLNKNVEIRSKEFPHFILIKGELQECLRGDFEYTIESGSQRYSFDSVIIKEVILKAFFINGV